MPAVAAPPIVIPFEYANHHIYVDVSVNGRAGRLIFDTGTSLTTLDAAWAATLDLAPLATPAQARVSAGGGAPVDLKLATARSVRVAGIEITNTMVAVMNLDAVSRASGRAVQGTLGGDFIRRYVIEVDYAARTLTVHDPATFAYEGRGTVVPIALAPLGVPVVEATITSAGSAPIAARLALDTGTSSFGAILTTPFVDAHGLAAPGKPVIESVLGVGVGGLSTGWHTRLDAISIGGLTVPTPTAALGREREGFIATTIVDGTLGEPIFERTKMILDYAHSRVIFEPRPHFDAPYEYDDASGLLLGADAPDFRRIHVLFVAPTSPAADVGLRADDELLSIDGRPVAELSLARVRELLRTPGVTRRVKVRRGEAEVGVEVRLRKLL